MIAKIGAMIANPGISGASHLAYQTLATPLRPSKSSVRTAIGYPLARIVLVVPVLPLPIFRISTPFTSFERIQPKGMAPRKYENNRLKRIFNFPLTPYGQMCASILHSG